MIGTGGDLTTSFIVETAALEKENEELPCLLYVFSFIGLAIARVSAHVLRYVLLVYIKENFFRFYLMQL